MSKAHKLGLPKNAFSGSIVSSLNIFLYIMQAHTLTTTFILLIRILIEDSCLYANMKKKFLIDEKKGRLQHHLHLKHILQRFVIIDESYLSF